MHVHYVCGAMDEADKIRAQLVCSPPVADCCCQSLGIRLWLHGVIRKWLHGVTSPVAARGRSAQQLSDPKGTKRGQHI